MNVGRSSSCIGENVTYICKIIAFNHIWNVNGSIMGRTLSASSDVRAEQEYTLRVVSVDGNDNIISSLSVNSSAGLNGTSISCEDGFVTTMFSETKTVAMVLGECVCVIIIL